jgi:hypothetical protein
MTQSYRGFSHWDKASQLPSNKREIVLMSKSLWVTPEEAMRKKKIKKNLLYFSIMFGTAILSTLVTFLANAI